MTIHSLVEYSAYCFDDIPKADQMAKVMFYPNCALSFPALATAYLSRTSKPFSELKAIAKAGVRVPCTLTLSWNTETDPARPILEVIRFESMNWTL